MELLKTQVRIRRKVLGQKIPIAFTEKRKQRSINVISKELCEFVDENPLPEHIRNPTSLVGKIIEETGGSTWYFGTVIDYSEQEKTHCLKYEEDSEHYQFDLTIDLILGDLILL